MGATVAADVPQGLAATMVAENELLNDGVPGLVTPQELVVKTCVMEAGGGCEKT